MLNLTRRFLLVGVIAVAVAPAAAAGKPKVVASFSILGDMAARVGGDLIELKTIVGANGDAHVYEPTPEDAKFLAAADLVVVNGLGFEGWFDRLVAASGYRGQVVTATTGIATATMGDNSVDPHAWQNAANATVYSENIAKALCEADGGNCKTYKTNATAYEKELATLDAEIKSAVARVPADRRTVIMSHDAFGYFARAYGIAMLAPEGVSTDSEASAMDVAKLVTQIREKKAAALFVENIADPRLIEQIARETGLTIGGELYSDALSRKDGPAATYLDLMRHNARLITQAMAGS